MKKVARKYAPEPLTDDEVELILDACSRRAPSGIRNKALIQVLHRGMLRISEALALRPSDVDLDQGIINVRTAKVERIEELEYRDRFVTRFPDG